MKEYLRKIRRMEKVFKLIIIGNMLYANHDHYSGDWKDDLKNGYGKSFNKY